MHTTKRRDFLRLAYNTTLLSALGSLAPTAEAQASTDSGFSDYKALVMVLLEGGNDGFNMVLPTTAGGDNGYDNYKNMRSSIAIKDNDLFSKLKKDANGDLILKKGFNPYLELQDKESNKDSYLSGMYKMPGTGIGLNGIMPELAHLMDRGDLAVIANVGTLVEPTLKDDIKNGSAKLPIYLFAHNHQRKVQNTGKADSKSIVGWVGRLFDNWGDVNGGNLLGSNVSFNGGSDALIGTTTMPLLLDTNPVGYKHRSRTTENVTLDIDVKKSLYSLSSENIFHDLYNRMTGRSVKLSNEIATAWATARTFNSTNPYGDKLFSVPNETTMNLSRSFKGKLMEQLEAVTKMIDYGKANGVKRQVFRVRLDGFDTHAKQTDNHAKLLRELSLAFGDFQRALDEMNVTNEVTTFTYTDFGRTATSNGDGTDHAWAGHGIVMGGAVKGGIYGEMPDLRYGGIQDYGRNGRIIPTISIDQEFATITKWFGADDALNDIVFPNLKNFDNSTLGRDLGFMS